MSGAFEIRPVGDRGLLLELSSNTAVHAVAAVARERFGDQLSEVVPGHTTLLLVRHEGGAMPDPWKLASTATADFEQSRDADARAAEPPPLTIPVRYDGQDLPGVARALRVDRERVVELHSAALYTVAFMGFAPGFPYLIGLPVELELPRLPTPRLEVPSGSVAVAAGYCGIYPRSSPGGWNLLGRTEVALFDPAADPPALLAPGDRVRFEPV